MLHIFSTTLSLNIILAGIFSPSVQANSIQKIFQFPNHTWIENIAIRRNGQILADILDRPELYQIDPLSNPTTSKLIHRFDQYAGGLLGISELEEDQFAIILGNYSIKDGPTPGSFAIWEVDFRNLKPAIKKIADISPAHMLNGMASLNSDVLLMADSKLGVIFRLDIKTREYSIVIDDDSMKPKPNKLKLTIGVNGLKVKNGYLYYTNTFLGSLMRVPVHNITGKALGPVEIVGPTEWIADDIVVTDDETTYVAGSVSNVVTKVSRYSRSELIAGNENSSIVAGATAVVLGRTDSDRNVLYVSDNGGMAAPVNGTFVEGGKIVAISL
jgi:hypothetical protein